MDINVAKHCPVHEAYQFTSPHVTTAHFKEQCETLIGSNYFHSNSSKKEYTLQTENEELATCLKSDLQTVEELQDVCSIDKLQCDLDDKYDYNKLRVFKDFPPDVPLETIRMCKELKTKMEEIHYVPSFSEPVQEEINKDDILVKPGEVIINIAVLHPKKRKVLQEFFVLPNQRLTELRDLISCQSDNLILGEFSNNPDLSYAKITKDLLTSSFFFIEQCFYNDTRNSLNRDYSKAIIEWAKSSDRYTVPGLGLFQSQCMEDTCFKDLNIRLGYPYLYCHQGNCEHIVVFKDMRVITENDPQDVRRYPFKINEACKRQRKCSVCNIHMIKWMTVNDALAFEDPSFFCEKCFDYLHYSSDKQKISSFEAFPYIVAD